MINQQNLKRDVETLLESITISWCELSQTIDSEYRIKIRKQLGYYHDELKTLITQTL
jgi:hypothetical protein